MATDSADTFELRMLASVERGLVDVAIAFLADLAELTGATVHLRVRQGSEVV